MIISGGENVYPAEIEDVLLAHPGDRRRRRDRHAVGEVGRVAARRRRRAPTPTSTSATVLEHCHGKLARYKLPAGAVFTDVIPRNPTGKALKRVLREQFPLDAPD